MSVATNAARMEELLRGASMAKCFGLEVHTMTPSEIASTWAGVTTSDLVGGVFLPKDGRCNPIDTTQALAKGARNRGAKIFENTAVEKILIENGKAVGVRTAQGEIRADMVVNCAGMWAHELGAQTGTTIPLHAAEHFYIVTEPMAGLHSDLPVMRDPDNCAYFKEDAGKLLVGWFEPVSKPWGMAGIPETFCFDQLPDDLEHIEPLLASAMERIPALATTGINLFFNGPESFTPDDRYLLGETPEVRNLFVAAGFNSIGIQSAGGAGKALADWMLDGHPPMDLWDVDVRRCMPFQRNKHYLRDRTTETLGLLYAMHWPFRQPETARGVRQSILHDRLKAHGACFGETAGWERTNWFAPAGVKPEYAYSYGRQNWFEHSAAEHMAVRNGVGMFDQSSFAKFVVQGPDAQAVLNRICANDVAVPVGKLVYTQWLNERGGIEADLTVTREAPDRFMVVTAAATQTRDFAWLQRHIPSDARAVAVDVSSSMAVLSVMGPKSRELLQSLTSTDLSNAAFPFGTSQIIDLGYARVRASRITYVGELGWELYIPTECAPNVFDVLIEAGKAFDLKLCGYHALNSLRMEKGYRHWGHDISDEDSPLQGGLGFAVAMNKPSGFIGREALIKQKAEGLTRKLLQFALHDASKLLYHNEPVLRDGAIVGRISSGMFGHALGQSLGMGYVEFGSAPGAGDAAQLLAGNYEIEVAGVRVAATPSLAPFYDPKSLRIKG
jgi:4-methylaminobutanoate oxidase (formaldehyde-forming)